MGKYFGTDGFRGEATCQTDSRSCISRGTVMSDWYYGRDHKAKIVIGKDTRQQQLHV